MSRRTFLGNLRLALLLGVLLFVALGAWLDRRRSTDWDAPLLAYLGLDRARLPGLIDRDEALPPLREEWARRWPSEEVWRVRKRAI